MVFRRINWCGGIGWFERRSSTEVIEHIEKAKIIEIDTDKSQIVISFKIEPFQYYRPRYLEFDFRWEPAFDTLVYYQVNGIPATAHDFVLGIPMMLVVDGKQDFFHSSQDSDYRHDEFYFMSYDSPYHSYQRSKPTDRADIIFSLKRQQELAQDLEKEMPEISVSVTNTRFYEQSQLLQVDRDKLIFENNSERDIYRLRWEWYDYADTFGEKKSDYLLPGYHEKGLMVDAANMMDLNIYRTMPLANSHHDFLSFDEHWQVSQGRLMSVELISSSYEGGVILSSCWFGAEIRRDEKGKLRRYLNQWVSRGSQRTIEMNIDDPLFVTQSIHHILQMIDENRGYRKDVEMMTSGDEENCSAKLDYIQQILLMDEDALLMRLEDLKKLIMP